MSIKKNLKNTILCTITYSLNSLSSFIITTLLIRVLGNEAYSFYPISNNISNWIIVIGMAINAMAGRFIAVNIQAGDIKRANKYYTSTLFSNIFICALLLLPMVVLTKNANNFINIPNFLMNDVRLLFLFTCLSVFVNMLTTVFAISEQAKDRLDLQYCARIVYTVIRLSSIIIIFTFYKPCLAGVGFSLLLAEITHFFIQLSIKSKIMPELAIHLKDFDSLTIKELTASNIWCSINNLGNSFLLQLDAIVSNIYLGMMASAAISIVATVPNAITSLISALINVFMPSMYHDFALNNKKSMISNIKSAQKIVSFATSLICCIFVVFAVPFFKLWVPASDPILLFKLSLFYVIPLIFSGMFRVVGNVSIAMNKLQFFACMTLINGIINIMGVILLLNFTSIGIYAITITTFLINCVWYCIIIPKYISILLKIKILEFYKVPFKQGLLNIFWILIFVILRFVYEIHGWGSLIVAIFGSIILALISGWLIIFKNEDFMLGDN